ncbi:Ig-like domain (group 3) [Asanoa hainanensis]|uniref:Ig-like domain (Group 3) n=1 Tax=Asanoa hainanensis TaxID=560556 RepID=A0A239K3R7_9ACTN|nr:Ig-like domain-containing protein [Asanoa hainanensis]SNT12309.1 Ig-like domain (group 3) [Asanoa hainanensis]
MHRRRLTRLVARAALLAAAVTSIAGGTLVIATSGASAASLGEVELSQTQGYVTDTPMFASAKSKACPAGFGENASLRVGPAPSGPYNNLAVSLGGGGFDQADVEFAGETAPNRSFTTAMGGVAPAEGNWVVIIECYSLTEGRNTDEFRTPIRVCGARWAVGTECPGKDLTFTTLTVSPSWSVLDDVPVTLTAAVTPAGVGGEVEFFYGVPGEAAKQSMGKVAVADGKAELTTSDIPVNESGQFHELSAVFTPIGEYQESTSNRVKLNVRQTADPMPTAVAIEVTPKNGADVGAEVTIAATIEPAGAAGKVAFSYRRGDDPTDVPIGAEVSPDQNVATTKTTELPGGKLTITATFVPGEGFGPSTTSLPDYQVGEPVKQATTVTLSPSKLSPQPENTAITLTATVGPAGTAGVVQFRSGPDPLGEPKAVAANVATLDLGTLPPGSYVFTAEFQPTDTATFATSTSAPVNFVIDAIGPETPGDDDPDGDDPGEDDPDDDDGGNLALTGAPVVGVAMVGAGLVGVGALAMTTGRRRRLLPAVPWLDRRDDDN